MSNRYFHRVAEQTGTRLWINNPTMAEARLALEAGAIACTTNPTHSARMLRMEDERDAALAIVDAVLRDTADDAEAATLVQRQLIARMAEAFMPVYRTSNGTAGFVSLQLNPHLEHDTDRIVEEALADFALFPNCIAKIPVVPSGLKAIDRLVRLNRPVIATEIMAISQALAVCEVYRKASEESGNKPAFFVTHISGIFDDQLKEEAAAAGITLSPEATRLAGCAIARRQYALMQERHLPGILLGGGARGLHHFTELVGGSNHITMNWVGSVQNLLEQDPEVMETLQVPVSESILLELSEKMPTFRKAYAEDGLKPEEFNEFSPVVRFRNQFLRGWDELQTAIRERRVTTGIQAAPHRKFFKVGDHEPFEIRPGVFRSTLAYNGDNMLCHFVMRKGAHIDLHCHKAVQSGYVIRGSVAFFDAAGNARMMAPGDGYLFQSDEPHGADAMEESEFVECFTPLRPEYLDV